MTVARTRQFLLLAATAVFAAVAVASLLMPHRMASQLGYELTNVDALSEFRAVYVGIWLATAILLTIAAARIHWPLLGDLGAVLILGQTFGRLLSLALDGMPSARIWPFFILELVAGAAILLTRPPSPAPGASRGA